ncbi:MAG: glycosyltransferase family 4 protein [Deltaproteobacteria bacterium]|nr:glycosyltransferase family 4 protein [Deltaproteobacteria bacterium]
MRIGVVFHKNPFAPPTGIDLVRLRAIAGGLIRRGFSVDVIAPVHEAGLIDRFIPVKPLNVLGEGRRYDLIKTSYHFSIRLIDAYTGPVVSRIVRVVDHEAPQRDEPFREDLLSCQEMIRRRASVLVLNNRENEERWRRFYGPKPPVLFVPNGCPSEIPEPGLDPYGTQRPAALFLGSVAAARMARVLNEAAVLLRGRATIHLVGLNKSRMYGGDGSCRLSRLIVDHGETSHNRVWDYIHYAQAGIALATGPHPFDNDISKIFDYLRGGLPVVSEEGILQNHLIERTGFGRIFAYDNVEELVSGVLEILERPPIESKEQVMSFMAREHSWERRLEQYVALFQALGGGVSR